MKQPETAMTMRTKLTIALTLLAVSTFNYLDLLTYEIICLVIGVILLMREKRTQ